MEICVARISRRRSSAQVSRTPTKHASAVSLLRGVSREARRHKAVRVYAMDNACALIKYDPTGVPLYATLAWLSDAKSAQPEMLVLLDDVWRAASLSAAP